MEKSRTYQWVCNTVLTMRITFLQFHMWKWTEWMSAHVLIAVGDRFRIDLEGSIGNGIHTELEWINIDSCIQGEITSPYSYNRNLRTPLRKASALNQQMRQQFVKSQNIFSCSDVSVLVIACPNFTATALPVVRATLLTIPSLLMCSNA